MNNNVLIVDGPLRGEVRECTTPSFMHNYADPPGWPVAETLYKQLRYTVIRMEAFTGTMYIATSKDEPDAADLAELILSPAAKATMR